MVSSGTYSFAPSLGSLTLAAYARIGKRRPSLLAEHMVDAQTEINLLSSSWSNRSPPNLWTVELVTVTLTQSTATYSVAASTVMILDAYLSFTASTPVNDRIIFPVSRTEYASFPNKAAEGTPSVFWFDRILSPTITLWLTPGSSTDYNLNYFRCTQNQDAALASGQTPAVPFRFFDAMVADLSHRLARIYAPELEDKRKRDADEAWALAAIADTENVPMSISPQLSSYFNT